MQLTLLYYSLLYHKIFLKYGININYEILSELFIIKMKKYIIY